MVNLHADIGYIGEHDPQAASCFNHMALEAAIRAVEDDESIPRYHLSQFIDVRSYAHLNSVAALRDLIRDPSFELDLVQGMEFVKKTVYHTPYSRSVTKGFMTNHYVIETSKGRLVLDMIVKVVMHKGQQG